MAQEIEDLAVRQPTLEEDAEDNIEEEEEEKEEIQEKAAKKSFFSKTLTSLTSNIEDFAKKTASGAQLIAKKTASGVSSVSSELLNSVLDQNKNSKILLNFMTT